MDIFLNESALKIFDRSVIDDIVPDDSYPVWKKEDPFGRVYYGVGNFCGLDRKIREDTDLSWLEWDGNEVHLSDKDKDLLFRKAVGIIKGWADQLVKDYPEDRFVVFASFDDGSSLVEECEMIPSFTLRFWKKREGQGLDENTDFDQPVIRWSN